MMLAIDFRFPVRLGATEQGGYAPSYPPVSDGKLNLQASKLDLISDSFIVVTKGFMS